jgi:hypothetical protein
MRYVANYHAAMRVWDECSNSAVWLSFLLERESQHKVALSAILEQPLKIIAQYYLHLEVSIQFSHCYFQTIGNTLLFLQLVLKELLRYTPLDHPDYKNLSICHSRAREHIGTHKSMGRTSTKKKGKLTRKISVENIFDTISDTLTSRADSFKKFTQGKFEFSSPETSEGDTSPKN